VKDQDFLDDAIDRTVRDMTNVAPDEQAVVRVMARLREAQTRTDRVNAHRVDARDENARDGNELDTRDRDARERWTFVVTPRAAWAGAAALVIVAMVVTGYMRRSVVPDDADSVAPTRNVAINAPRPSSTPSPSATSPATTAATAAVQSQTNAAREMPTRVTRRASTVRAATVTTADDAFDALPEIEPFKSDLEIADITPQPIGDAQAIPVAPLVTSSLTVEAIPIAPIEIPPASAGQHR
jgi:hypothetical protein